MIGTTGIYSVLVMSLESSLQYLLQPTSGCTKAQHADHGVVGGLSGLALGTPSRFRADSCEL